MRLVSCDRLAVAADWRPAAADLTAYAELVAPLGRPDWHAELAWVGDETIRDLNARFRGRDETTDVLSFSNLVAAGPGSPALAEGEGGARSDLWWEAGGEPEGGAVGEIVIAPGFVAERCAERGWDFAAELPWLVVHGALHLLGWDHMETAEASAMQTAERDALARCGRRHPLLDDGDGRGDQADGR